MGNTVLTYLKKIKHPIMVERIKNSTREYYSHTNKNSMFHANINKKEMNITLYFKQCQEKYEISLRPNYFNLTRYRPKNYNSRDTAWQPDSEIMVAILLKIPYNEFEEMIFQQSLINDLGMFSSQEAKMLLELRNIFFGDDNEST